MKTTAQTCSVVLYVIAMLTCFTGLGFFIATAAGASAVLLDIGIWLILGAVAVAIIARALTGKKLVD